MKLNTDKLELKIEEKRKELNRLFGEQGLNDFTLKKSQDLDKLIATVQRHKLDELQKARSTSVIFG